MYLKELKAHGFKSFADKTNIELGPGITGIVGPNGSGKSNVVDAVRWVLGEQSVKSLRGEGTMTDVIFSGSKSRNPLNVATVTLVFSNEDHYLPLDFDEVSISRRVYQDGTNEYFINRERCRLKDVTDLFLDSGIGKESFNIISQGKIDEILSNKPEDRRGVFEEAAGVLKYKKRKMEALHKLDRTHDNLSRVDDIIHELELQVEPLKKEKEKALAYQKIKSQLEELELSLLTNDITKLNETYQRNKNRMEELNQELIALSTKTSKNEVQGEGYRKKSNDLSKEINDLQKALLETTKRVEQENSRKQILLERKKYEVEDDKIHENIIDLTEKKNGIQVAIETSKKEVEELEIRKNEQFKKKEELEEAANQLKKKKEELDTSLRMNLKNRIVLENKILMLQESIEKNASLPYAVRSILENPKLRGICDAIGNIIEVEEKYATAISTSLGVSTSYLIVENEISAKEAIQYLKNQKIGRATFFPLNVIKPRGLEEEILQILGHMEGFVAVAKDLVKCDPKYQNIIANQLGNVIVARNIDDANIISRRLNHRYKIVTLDGELLHVGGSISGGNDGKVRNRIRDQYDLEHLLNEKQSLDTTIQLAEEKINEQDHELKGVEDKLYLVHREQIQLEEQISSKRKQIEAHSSTLRELEASLNDLSHMKDHTLSEEEETVIQAYYDALSEKNRLETELNGRLKDRASLNDLMEEQEAVIRRENINYNRMSKELHDLEIEVNRTDVKLDTLLTTLNETYHMTYEKAKDSYLLEKEESVARNEASNLKRDILELGSVNENAPEEYAKVSGRYEFLISQKEDLKGAENTLLEIIEEMDEVMKEEFSKTFEEIRKHFKETFKELFKGGSADLKLTDPKDLLETGIEIVASPPGKKLTTISLLSGGEKTFTAISLLFAILKSRPVPFCILDEVEAALDEVNVDSFGNYLKNLQSETQFILITHKKKTMEYADVLYGITMQESGVSKLVSVKLEEVKV